MGERLHRIPDCSAYLLSIFVLIATTTAISMQLICLAYPGRGDFITSLAKHDTRKPTGQQRRLCLMRQLTINICCTEKV